MWLQWFVQLLIPLRSSLFSSRIYPMSILVDQIQPNKKKDKLIQIPSVLRKIVKVLIFMRFSITDQAELRWYIFALLLQSYIFFPNVPLFVVYVPVGTNNCWTISNYLLTFKHCIGAGMEYQFWYLNFKQTLFTALKKIRLIFFICCFIQNVFIIFKQICSIKCLKYAYHSNFSPFLMIVGAVGWMFCNISVLYANID